VHSVSTQNKKHNLNQNPSSWFEGALRAWGINKSDLRWIHGMIPDLTRKDTFGQQLIGDIVKDRPATSEVMKKYFGPKCLEKPGFKIKTLEIACILFGIDQNRLIQELENNWNGLA
jgi:hypothetical protein